MLINKHELGLNHHLIMRTYIRPSHRTLQIYIITFVSQASIELKN